MSTVITTESKHLDVDIRWLIRRDLQEVLDIETKSFQYPWTTDEFLSCLKCKSTIGLVAEYNDEVVGFVLYELEADHLHILNFAVLPDVRNQDIGTQLVAKLVNKLSRHGRRFIVLEVRETNLDAQLFFKRMGFLAVEVIRDHYKETEEAAYVMRLDI